MVYEAHFKQQDGVRAVYRLFKDRYRSVDPKRIKMEGNCIILPKEDISLLEKIVLVVEQRSKRKSIAKYRLREK